MRVKPTFSLILFLSANSHPYKIKNIFLFVVSPSKLFFQEKIKFPDENVEEENLLHVEELHGDEEKHVDAQHKAGHQLQPSEECLKCRLFIASSGSKRYFHRINKLENSAQLYHY